MKVPLPFATFVVEEDTLVVLVVLGIYPKRSQPLSQRRLRLTNQRSLTTKDPKIFGYLECNAPKISYNFYNNFIIYSGYKLS